VGVTKRKKTWPLVLLAAWLVFNGQADPENKDLRHRFVSHRIVLKHPGINENKPRTYSLSQTLDERGHPVGYSMEVDSVICTVGLCKVVKVMMKWDAVGFYRGYSVADGSILEKALIGDAKASPEKKPWGGQLIGGNAVRNKKAWTAFNDADHAELALLFTELDMEGRVYLLGVLDAESTITGSLLDKFSQGLKNVNTYYELHRFLSLVEKQQQVSEIILTRVSRFLEDENFFIARRAFLFLEKQSLNEPMAKQVAAFEAKCERKNRMLR